MENSEKKPSAGRKIYIAAALFLILVGLPAVSWFYLRGGFNWRKQAIAELANYGKIRPAYVIWPNNVREDLLDGNVVVVHIFGENPDLTEDNDHILGTCEKLVDQFGQNFYFRVALISQNPTAEFRSRYQTIPSIERSNWVFTGGLGSWRTIILNAYESFCLAEGKKPDKEYYALADTSGTIRRFYNALDEGEVNRMVQHIAILLPPVE
jgi:hypothetical protein